VFRWSLHWILLIKIIIGLSIGILIDMRKQYQTDEQRHEAKKATRLAWYYRNQEKAKATMKRYYQANKDTLKAKNVYGADAPTSLDIPQAFLDGVAAAQEKKRKDAAARQLEARARNGNVGGDFEKLFNEIFSK
jgi:hypothetical protein